ncbi:competence/damage-inducible protein A [Sphingomonas sabuli]|uniref:competence/damage-inducible protein A n=1 Tax=Sphingomonas sabuli TaxID=2764186 RepID=UPI001FECE501|nr:molybdopterin-binding protein [Sphingomonas sabuli]
MDERRTWTAALLVIGDEILSGRTEDKNIAQVAHWLDTQGVRLREVRVVPDDQAAIVSAVNWLRPNHDYLFTTGGIGPTHDDITIESIAAAFDVPVIIHPEARRILEEYYRDRPQGLTEARLRMARVPSGAELIPNQASGAPGVKMGNVYILAGVPNIARTMLEALDGALEGGQPMASVTIRAFAAESDVADLLKAVQDAHPGTQIGSYPFYRSGMFGADFVVRSDEGAKADAAAAALRERLAEAGVSTGEAD